MEDKILPQISKVINEQGNETYDLEKMLSRYLIIGSLGAIGVILNFYQKNIEKSIESISFTWPLILFSISFAFGVFFLVANLISKRNQSKRLLNLYKAQLEFDIQQEETSEFDKNLKPFLENIKARTEALKLNQKLEPILFYFTLSGGALSFSTGFMLSIFTIISAG